MAFPSPPSLPPALERLPSPSRGPGAVPVGLPPPERRTRSPDGEAFPGTLSVWTSATAPGDPIRFHCGFFAWLLKLWFCAAVSSSGCLRSNLDDYRSIWCLYFLSFAWKFDKAAVLELGFRGSSKKLPSCFRSDVLLDEFVHFTHTYIFLLILFADRKFLMSNSLLKHQIICMRFCPKIL